MSLYATMGIKTCTTSQIAVSLENIKVLLYKMFVKHVMALHAPYGYCLKMLCMRNWCWACPKHHFLHHNQWVVEEFTREQKKGSMRSHFTWEASPPTEDYEVLLLGTDLQFSRLLLSNSLASVLRSPPHP
jgi:hypothetical protein